MDKIETSIENLLMNYDSKTENTKVYDWGMRDLNNVEFADRKLIVNKKYEFWVHDDALCANSDYFAELFGKIIVMSTTINASFTTNEDEIKKTEITIPYDNLFFDVLFWIYTKDTKKLKKKAKTFQSFLYLISLGIHLKMKSDFFEILLTKTNFEWKIDNFSDPLWSKTIFTFPILERIVDEMKTNNFTKIIALLSWLKEINSETATILDSLETTERILTSQDLFLVRNYIKVHNIMRNLSGKEINILNERFPYLQSSFDTATILDQFLFSSEKKLVCLICKKEYVSPFEVAEAPECKGEYFHPKNSVHVKNDKISCLHEGCNRKLAKGEHPCCHKVQGSPGCLLAEGKHMIILAD